MKCFLKNNLILFGNSCSGKTFIFKKIKFQKIDTDFFLTYKKIYFNNEFFFRKFEYFFLKNFYVKNKIIVLGGGSVQFLSEKNFLKNTFFYKKINFINFIKRFKKDNNRPLLKNKKKIKIIFVIRKKKYKKISNLYLNKCFFCNLKII